MLICCIKAAPSRKLVPDIQHHRRPGFSNDIPKQQTLSHPLIFVCAQRERDPEPEMIQVE